jgi:cysteine desulfurase
MKRIYLDHAATTPLAPEVRAAMEPWLSSEFGNPSSLHEEGRRARQALDEAREVLSGTLGCLFAEVLFTSSGTEAANAAILGTALANVGGARRRVLLGAAEHHCVLHSREPLEALGFQVDVIPVDREARLQLDALQEMLADDVLLVSVMHANNELGTIQDVQEISALAHSAGALFHCDAVQTFTLPRKLVLEGGEGTWTVDDLGVDLLNISAHKIHGPKGIGALYVRAGTKLKPVLVGGGQEREMRAGTENVAGIVGLAEAVRLALDRDWSHPGRARDRFVQVLQQESPVPPALSVAQAPVLPGHAHLRLPGISAETMLIKLDRMGVSASSGAACSSGSLEPSHVLLSCGYSEVEAREGLRFTFGHSDSEDLAEEAARRVALAAEDILKAR